MKSPPLGEAYENRIHRLSDKDHATKEGIKRPTIRETHHLKVPKHLFNGTNLQVLMLLPFLFVVWKITGETEGSYIS